MNCRKEALTIHSRPILYFENGFRTVSAEKTLTEIEKMLLSTTFQMKTEVRWVADTPFLYHFFYIWGSHSKDKEELFLGKGMTEEQCLISSIMEFIERFCAGNLKDDQVQYRFMHQYFKEL
jgi:ribosomal protein S12 methylthiotransferase accessory factor YcaO